MMAPTLRHASVDDDEGVFQQIAAHLAEATPVHRPLAVFDIDDTVLISESQRANALVLRIMHELLLPRHISLAYVTARRDGPVSRMWARQQLHMLGAPAGVALHLMPRDQYATTMEGVRAFKHDCRAALEKDGYSIVLNVGDQWTDFDPVASCTASCAPCAYYWWNPSPRALALKLPHRVMR